MLIYILLRLFTIKRKFIEGDELRHMQCARNFYKLWNKDFYDTHPPLYSLLMRPFYMFGYFKAGVIVSLLSSIVLYQVSGKLYDLLGLAPEQKLVALACLTFNYTLIYYSNKAFRYQLLVLLGTSMIYFTLSANYIMAGISWGLLSLTCSYAGLRAFWIWILLSPKFDIVSPLIFLVFYGSWILNKFLVYKNSEYYPSGIDGKIEPVQNVTFRQLISPLYFPWTYSYYGRKELGYELKNWYKKIGGIFGFYQGNNKLLNILLGGLTGVMGYFVIRGMVAAHTTSFRVVILALILLYPSLLKRFLPRNSIIAIPLLCYFIGRAAVPIPLYIMNWIIGLSLIGYFIFHRTFIYFEPKIKARVTSSYLDSLPGAGVLVEGLIAYPIVFRSNKRVVVIPHNPERSVAERLVNISKEYFLLDYAVISNLYLTEIHLGYPAIEYIKTFPLIKTIMEDGDIYHIYGLRGFV